MAKRSQDAQLHIWTIQNQLLLEHGVDLVNRTFCINRDIDRTLFQEVDAKLALLERDCAAKPLPITIKLNSCGGGIYDAWAICSRIKSSKCQITIEAHGAIMSAATMIFAAGHKRRASNFCTFMFHQSSTRFGGSVAELRNELQVLDKEERMYINFLAKASKKSAKFWSNMLNLRKDVYLNSEQMKKLGLVDEVF